MEGIGFALLGLLAVGWFAFTAWRDEQRWNDGICKETGSFWEFTGGVSFLGMYCYRGGIVNGDPQYIWLHDLRKPVRHRNFPPGTSC